MENYYFPLALLIVTALRQGRNPDHTLEQLRGFCRVWRSTVNHWKHNFQELFPQSIGYRRLAGHLIPPLDFRQLAKAILDRFESAAKDLETALVNCLRTLALGP